jgi:hypothetical protein
MYINLSEIRDKNFMDQYFDTTDYDYDGKVDAVKKMIEESKTRMNEVYNMLEKNFIGKIKFHSKEFIFKRFKTNIEDKFDEFEGKGILGFVNFSK